MIEIILAAMPTLGLAPLEETPREFGSVQWRRELEPALELSAKANKPVLLLFQEVPG